MRKLIALAIVMAALALSTAPAGLDAPGCVNDSRDCSDSRAWKCLANGQEVWKVFCKRYWAELFDLDDDEDNDT